MATASVAGEKPAAVSDALRERFGGDTVIDGVEARLMLGVPVYHVSLHEGGRDLHVEVSSLGEVLTIRTRGRVELLPEAARAALPDLLRKRDISVWRIELLHGLAGESSPRVRHLVEAGERSWLFADEGQLLAELPASSAMSAGKKADPTAALGAPDPAAAGAATASAVPAVAEESLTRVADVRRGQAVVLRGEVRRVRDTDEFILADSSGQIEVYIGWQNDMPVTKGQTVTVHGRADDTVFPGFRPDIYASRIVLPDGRAVELRRGKAYE